MLLFYYEYKSNDVFVSDLFAVEPLSQVKERVQCHITSLTPPLSVCVCPKSVIQWFSFAAVFIFDF